MDCEDCRALGHPGCWHRGWPSVHVWEQSDAPSHSSGDRRMFPGQPFLGVTPLELPLGGFRIPLHSAGPKSHFVTLLLAC